MRHHNCSSLVAIECKSAHRSLVLRVNRSVAVGITQAERIHTLLGNIHCHLRGCRRPVGLNKTGSRKTGNCRFGQIAYLSRLHSHCLTRKLHNHSRAVAARFGSERLHPAAGNTYHLPFAGSDSRIRCLAGLRHRLTVFQHDIFCYIFDRIPFELIVHRHALTVESRIVGKPCHRSQRGLDVGNAVDLHFRNRLIVKPHDDVAAILQHLCRNKLPLFRIDVLSVYNQFFHTVAVTFDCNVELRASVGETLESTFTGKHFRHERLYHKTIFFEMYSEEHACCQRYITCKTPKHVRGVQLCEYIAVVKIEILLVRAEKGCGTIYGAYTLQHTPLVTRLSLSESPV